MTLATMEMLYFHLFRRNEIETYNDLSASAAAAQTRMAKDMVAKRIMKYMAGFLGRNLDS